MIRFNNESQIESKVSEEWWEECTEEPILETYKIKRVVVKREGSFIERVTLYPHLYDNLFKFWIQLDYIQFNYSSKC